jgi:uncharacterized protein (DUF488 family)
VLYNNKIVVDGVKKGKRHIKMKELFTIGHSNHTLEHFLELLIECQISAIVDVRSSPYSQYLPHFNKELLENALRNANIDYMFLGRELGARRSEEGCYIKGQAKYEIIAHLPIFRVGLKRLLEGIETYRIALMCSEVDPIVCHRTILVCREIIKVSPDLKITHILGDGTTERHEHVQERLVKLHKLQPELFGDLTSLSGLIEKAFDLQAERIAYGKVPAEA